MNHSIASIGLDLFLLIIALFPDLVRGTSKPIPSRDPMTLLNIEGRQLHLERPDERSLRLAVRCLSIGCMLLKFFLEWF